MLHILGTLYGQVIVPDVVRDEYEAGRQAGEPALEDQDWITFAPSEIDPDLADALDPGEAAAISIALKTRVDAVLLDERLGRRVATQFGLPVVGTLAILLRAKQAGLLVGVRPVLDEMVGRGMRVGPDLRTRVLREAGEET
jgi:predicted nucleic acid-binding protein